MSTSPPRSIPPLVTELLRLCLVALFAGLGYQVGAYADAHTDLRGTLVVGVVLGAAIGYVVGGAVGRLTVRSVDVAESVLTQRSSEQLLAGVLGGTLGVIVGVGISWPLLLIRPQVVSLPIFAFVIIAVAFLGYRIGQARRDTLLNLVSGRAGLNRPNPNTAVDRVLDTSIAIDGRILDVVRAGFLHGRMFVIQPVLDELQGLADSADDAKRSRGRRGLDLLEALQRERSVDLEVLGDEFPEVPEVDAKLVRVCLARDAALLTLDTPLAKSAGLAGCRVMNLHALALAVRPPVSAGDTVTVLLTRAGKEAGQGVGYLDDGTMVVAEKARAMVGKEATVLVTSVLTTANGRMVFARLTSSG
ncbi:MAG: PIN/TRAM domain-containing protein [Actinomycetales bacterium]